VLPQEQAGQVGAREVRAVRAPARLGSIVWQPVERVQGSFSSTALDRRLV
jgi:hypothetical protein